MPAPARTLDAEAIGQSEQRAVIGTQQVPAVARHDPGGNEVKWQVRVRAVVPERPDMGTEPGHDDARVGRTGSVQQAGAAIGNVAGGDRPLGHRLAS